MLSTFLRCLVLRMMVGGLSHSRPAGAHEFWHQNLIDELHVRASSHQEHHLGAGQESFIQLCRPMLCPINSFPARTTGRLHSKAALSLRQPCKASMLLQACRNLYVVHVAQHITSLPNPNILKSQLSRKQGSSKQTSSCALTCTRTLNRCSGAGTPHLGPPCAALREQQHRLQSSAQRTGHV